MSRRVADFKRTARRRKRSLAAAVAAIAALGVFAITALAVHDEDFQLDADMFASTTTSVGGDTQTIDWDSLFTPNGTPPGSVRGATVKDPLPSGFESAGFDDDFNVNTNGSFNTSDGSTFATGSKDTLPITGGWQCNFDNNVNSKTDVMNAYATSYVSDSGDEILYFALERNANTGTGNVGFWFLQDEVACDSASGTGSFTGDHADGDLLVVAEFSNGGVVSTIQVYRWEGGADGSLNPNSVAGGVNLDCDIVTGGDSVCANVNTANINNVPWLTANTRDGVGHTLRAAEFFEAGLNLTDEGLGGKCFNTFIGDTRSSTSLTATIFDYSLGTLGACTSETVTTPSLDAPTEIPTDGTIDVTDDADVTVTGADEWSGTVQFYICGPTADIATCDPDTADELGAAVPVDQDTVMPVTSPNAEITEVGEYCFSAVFSGDESAGVPPSQDSSAGECFEITPVTPTLDTLAGTSPVDLGDPVTDTATLSGTANQPGTGGIGDGTGADNGSINPTTAGGPADGTITFTLVKQDDCSTLATSNDPLEENPQDVTVSGDDTYGPVSFTPNAPGDYSWQAEYSGDSPNTNGATHNDECDDTDEDVTVRQVPTAISTEQSVIPNDSATISSTVSGVDLPAGGTVTFRLYGSAGGNTALENCQSDDGTTGLVYEEDPAFTTAGGAETETFDTTNTTVSVSADDTYYWKVTYDPADSGFVGVQSDCSESTLLDFTNHAGPGTVFPDPTP